MKNKNDMKLLNVDECESMGESNFRRGYNCTQSVVLTFADVYGLSEDLALRVSASFGAGMGRMRMTCGAVSGMFLLAGLENGSVVAGDLVGRGKNYETVRELADKFKAETGSIICAELLGLNLAQMKEEGAMPSARTTEYYRKRPCPKMVGLACRIYAEFLNARVKEAESNGSEK